jgi:anti-anti-sigma factor
MIDFNYTNHELKCSFQGRLGADRSAEISDSINKKINEIKGSQTADQELNIVFDFEKVDFIASAFIRICITTFKQVGKDNFSIINTKPIIKKTFAIAGLTDEMNIS